MRYAIAFIVACLIVVAGVMIVRQTWGKMRSDFEQFKTDLKSQRDAGQLPPPWQGTDIDALRFGDVRTSCPA